MQSKNLSPNSVLEFAWSCSVTQTSRASEFRCEVTACDCCGYCGLMTFHFRNDIRDPTEAAGEISTDQRV